MVGCFVTPVGCGQSCADVSIASNGFSHHGQHFIASGGSRDACSAAVGTNESARFDCVLAVPLVTVRPAGARSLLGGCVCGVPGHSGFALAVLFRTTA
jgi:hypothetical protein